MICNDLYGKGTVQITFSFRVDRFSVELQLCVLHDFQHLCSYFVLMRFCGLIV